MPDLRDLNGLRHCWCWQKRPRPHLPTWSFAKVPRLQFSPEENARLMSVYMRPWTLRESESTNSNPLLSLLGKCEQKGEEWHPRWKTVTTKCAGSAQDAGTSPARKRRHIQMKPTEQEKYSFQVIKVNDYGPRHQERKQQSSRKKKKTWCETQRKADGIKQEDNAEGKVQSATCA